MRAFNKGTYKAKSFILRTSIGYYFMTKSISEMYLLEREKWLAEVLQSTTVQWNTQSYSFIPWWVKLTKTCIRCTVAFTQKELGGTSHLVFSKDGIARFHIWNFKSGWYFGRKSHFFSKSLGTTKPFWMFRLCLYSCCPSCKPSRTIWTMLLFLIFDKF